MLEADLVRAALVPAVIIGTGLIWRTGRHVAGRILILIGALHLSGGWVAREALERIVKGGFVNQADSGVGAIQAVATEELAFWFLLWGVFVIMIGQLVIAMEKRGIGPPRWLGFELLLVSLFCAILIPKAGFWWVTIPAWLIIREKSESGEHRTTPAGSRLGEPTEGRVIDARPLPQ